MDFTAINSDSDSDSDLGFSNLDLTGVDFDQTEDSTQLSDADQFALKLELETVSSQWEDATERVPTTVPCGEAQVVLDLANLINSGAYVDVLESAKAQEFFGDDAKVDETASIPDSIRSIVFSKLDSVMSCVEMELVGIAAFNLFLQINYTGPTFDIENSETKFNPHPCFKSKLKATEEVFDSPKITVRKNMMYQNAVLAELASDGEWPCQVVVGPYLLLLARSIFFCLSNPSKGDWAATKEDSRSVSRSFLSLVGNLKTTHIWSSRAAVAHERLFLGQEPTLTLWNEIEEVFPKCVNAMKDQTNYLQAMVLLEYGLACHHFDRPKRGKKLFLQAKGKSGLFLEVTGAEGKRTKFQQKATAQLVVRAASAVEGKQVQKDTEEEEKVKAQMIGFNEDVILHERVQFEEDSENQVQLLTILDQAILLGMCLDIKDSNPADRLTAEEMSAFLARVLCHHDDWIVYSTALLERAWLEFEGNHTKERSILQMQALADQHTDRLTITQSTKQSIEDSSPVQERIKNLHSIVYPPRWEMLRDVAERYAQIGIVTSAAEIFTEIEAWDEVVDCYRRAGKVKRAEEIVRERLEVNETPRMWTALGDITNDPSHYVKAVELSNGRFSQAHISLGKHYFDAGDLVKASTNYRNALKLRQLLPSVWFRVGTISMQLEDWDGALVAFTEVVQQHPEEAQAWANVAAVHMHNKQPLEAYPALNESLRHNRRNWRVWISKLYTCLDLKKFDEAAQACHMLLDLKVSNSAQGVPDLEEKCVRAIVGGVVDRYVDAKTKSDSIALDAARRSLTRAHELMIRIRTLHSDPWVFETTAYLYEHVGTDREVYENLMKEYRSLTAVRAWEKADSQVVRVCRTVSQIAPYLQGNKEDLVKCKFLLSGVVKKISQARPDSSLRPKEAQELDEILQDITAKLAV